MDNIDKPKLLETINTILDYTNRDRDIFIINDCKAFIDTLHAYRLEHLLYNIDPFIHYLDILHKDYLQMIEDNIGFLQSQTTIQALFLLSCAEFASGSKERMLIKEMETINK